MKKINVCVYIYIYICMVGSLYCTAEIEGTLNQLHFNKKFKNKKYVVYAYIMEYYSGKKME